DDLYDWVHAVGKRFYILKDRHGVYLHPSEDSPKSPRVQNNCYITKVMFLPAVPYPRKLSNGMWFDGKIGIWPIVWTLGSLSAPVNTVPMAARCLCQPYWTGRGTRSS
ncbi:unnamed protein product, partial [Choristocarpus tenellus]